MVTYTARVSYWQYDVFYLFRFIRKPHFFEKPLLNKYRVLKYCKIVQGESYVTQQIAHKSGRTRS